MKAVGAAKAVSLAFLCSLGTMRPGMRLMGFTLTPSDLIFVALALLLGAALALRQARLRWSPAYGLLAAYFAVLTLSAVVAEDLVGRLPKLATQIYLLSVAVVLPSVIDDEVDLRRACSAWLAGTVFAMLGSAASLVLYAAGHPLAVHGLFGFGSLPPGGYPRITSTFFNANMLCNYLTASLFILVASWRRGWVNPTIFLPLLAGLLTAAVLTISPGLAALSLASGIWLWALLKDRSRGASKVGLIGGAGAALMMLLVTTLLPVHVDQAPFLLAVPFLEAPIAPSIRLIIWAEAVQRITEAPLLGRGIGITGLEVHYVAPSGVRQQLTDAHNVYLSLAVQAGLAGLAALLLILRWVVQSSRPWRRIGTPNACLPPALGLAFLTALAVDGLTGSFEDARHVWAVLGLYLAAIRIEDHAASRSRSMSSALN